MIDHHWFISSWLNWHASFSLYDAIAKQRKRDRGGKRETLSDMIRPGIAYLYRVPLPYGTSYTTRPFDGHYRPDVEGTIYIGPLCWNMRDAQKLRREMLAEIRIREELEGKE